MSRELLQEAACALQNFLNSGFPDEWDDAVRQVNQDLIERLDAESEKPEPVEFGSVTFLDGIDDMDVYLNVNLPDGKYRLLAEKIND